MKEITTVTGIIAPEELGFCQCHEHIALSKGRSFEINPALCIDDMAKSLEELNQYHHFGGNSTASGRGIRARPGARNDVSGSAWYVPSVGL